MWHSVLEFQLTRLRVEKSFSFGVKCTVSRVFVKGCSVSELLACYGQIRSHVGLKMAIILSCHPVLIYMFLLFFIFPLFLGMVMCTNEFKTNEKQKLTEIKN